MKLLAVGDVGDYVAAVAPIVLGHFLVRPFKQGHTELPYLLDTNPTDIMFSRPLQREKGYTAVTYMFAHRDAEHILGNLQMLIPSGYFVFSNFGVLGLYSSFFLGGIMAALDPLELHLLQIKNIFGEAWKVIPQSWPMATRINDMLEQSGRTVADWLGDNNLYAGSSAGVFAIVAADACIVARDTMKLREKALTRPLNTSEQVKFLSGIVRVIRQIVMIRQELEGLQGPGGSTVNTVLLLFKRSDNIYNKIRHLYVYYYCNFI
eukprot:m.209643 g.209643  ORF g.209643 m.209643 type:complete len:263 (+) comp15817_c0_seq2:300-1088(+)